MRLLLPIWIIAACIIAGCSTSTSVRKAVSIDPSLERALAFLQREVPAWKRDNGCYSCHNNGDAARALFTAHVAGHSLPPDATADTLVWLADPSRWDDNQGDPGFSDQLLADVQFSAALLTALETGHDLPPQALAAAARRLLKAQAADGSWPVDSANRAGSPATYGTTLATFMAWRALTASNLPEVQTAITNAERALYRVKPATVPDAATLLWFSSEKSAVAMETLRGQSRSFLQRAQNGDGGWGPFEKSPSEPFDTALAIVALVKDRKASQAGAMIEKGRRFLAAAQHADGSWPATTRPPGGISYAQQMSTTAWATLAFLASSPPR